MSSALRCLCYCSIFLHFQHRLGAALCSTSKVSTKSNQFEWIHGSDDLNSEIQCCYTFCFLGHFQPAGSCNHVEWFVEEFPLCWKTIPSIIIRLLSFDRIYIFYNATVEESTHVTLLDFFFGSCFRPPSPPSMYRAKVLCWLLWESISICFNFVPSVSGNFDKHSTYYCTVEFSHSHTH